MKNGKVWSMLKEGLIVQTHSFIPQPFFSNMEILVPVESYLEGFICEVAYTNLQEENQWGNKVTTFYVFDLIVLWRTFILTLFATVLRNHNDYRYSIMPVG